jgi:putative flippase GtrA
VFASPAMAYSGAMLAQIVDRLVIALPAPLRRRVRPGHIRLLAQFTQFGFVGVAGFLVDTAVVYAVRDMVGLYVAGTLAYAVAVTCTWWLNRVWTFRGLGNVGPMHRQWMKFVVVNMPGLCLNLGTYFVLIATVAFCAANPVIAIFAGAIAGMFANFTLSRAVVFR